MKLTIESLASYLGSDASLLLADWPFKNWIFVKSFEDDLESPLIDYVFAQDGLDLVCDGDNKVRSIFIYSTVSRTFKEGVEDLPFTFSRQEVVAHLGSPAKSGRRISDPILGEYGAWDRFTRSSYVVHVEYRIDADGISKITLMRPDVVP